MMESIFLTVLCVSICVVIIAARAMLQIQQEKDRRAGLDIPDSAYRISGVIRAIRRERRIKRFEKEEDLQGF